MVERSPNTPKLLYTIRDVTRETGLGKATIKTLGDLQFINLPDGMGSGVKRISEEDLIRLKEAAVLLRLRHLPSQVVEILNNREKHLKALQVVINCIAEFDENPEDEAVWERYAQAVLEMSELEGDERNALSTQLFEKSSLSGAKVSRLLDRAYQQIGYSFIALVRLKTLKQE